MDWPDQYPPEPVGVPAPHRDPQADRPGADAARPVKAWVQGRRISASTPLASSLPSA